MSQTDEMALKFFNTQKKFKEISKKNLKKQNIKKTKKTKYQKKALGQNDEMPLFDEIVYKPSSVLDDHLSRRSISSAFERCM